MQVIKLKMLSKASTVNLLLITFVGFTLKIFYLENSSTSHK